MAFLSRPIVLIGGPTASGKSALALALARRLGGIIVNADSMQVYRELKVVTARPTAAEEDVAPHRLYGHVPAATPYSVAAWLADVKPVLDEAACEGRPVVLVGGTGLYFRALTQGLADHPPVPPEFRARLRKRLAREGAAALHAELVAGDLETAAAISPNDGQRILRALEVWQATGRSLTAWRRDGARPLLPPESTFRIIVEPERAELHRRIGLRLERMIDAGAMEEAAAFDRLGLDPNLPAAKAIGLRPLIAAACGEIPLSDALAHAAAETRRYAKRQSTWFRTQAPDWRRMAAGDAEATADALLAEAGLHGSEGAGR